MVDRRRHPGGRGRGHLPGRLGPGRLPVGHCRGFGRLADPAARLPADTRGGAAAHPRQRTSTFLRGASHSIAAAGASAILIMGFPVLLKATSQDLGAAGGVVILAVTLTRAPLLVPLTAMQGNLIAHFVDQRAGTGCGRWWLPPRWSPDSALLGVLDRRAARAVAAAGRVRTRLPRRRCACWPGSPRRRSPSRCSRSPAPRRWRPRCTGPTRGLDQRHAWRRHCCCCCRWTLETRTVVALLCGPLVGIAVHLVALAQSTTRRERVVCSASTRRYHDVWIVVPAFNEASVIGDVIADVRSVFGPRRVRRRRQPRRHRRARPGGRAHTWCAIRSISVRARPSRPASNTPAAGPVRRCSLPSTPTASTASRTSSA